MRLDHCKLDVDLVVSAPLQRTEAEPSWIHARDSMAIPSSLFQLYARAGYLSFGSAPAFLRDEGNILFSYFGMVLNSMLVSLVEASEEESAFIEAQARVYDPGKKARGESWDPSAAPRARRHFRYLVLSLQAALDALADLTAIFLTGLVRGVRLGRAQFSRIELWLQQPLPKLNLIITPQQHYLEKLYSTLRRLALPDGPEKDWLPLMRMFRNKGAHLGDAVFRYVGLHDDTGRFYTFVPRQWPHIWEKELKPSGSATSTAAQPMADYIRETLVHQDLVSFARGLRQKVLEVLEAGVAVLCEAYGDFAAFPRNDSALAELNGSSETHRFEYFHSTDREDAG